MKQVASCWSEGSRPTLFDNFDRTDGTPRSDHEDLYSFLNRAHQPYWDRVRRKLEEWFVGYPEEHALDLAERFKSRKPDQHFGAWWELYLFALFRLLGFDVEVHPALPEVGTRPDFRVTRGETKFYLEAATFFSGVVDSDRDAARDRWISDAVSKMSSPNFSLGLEISKSGREKPRDREITDPLMKWLATLDPDAVERDLRSGGAHPEIRCQIRDWNLEFTAFPNPPDRRSETGSVLVIGPGYAGVVNDQERARKSLDGKRSKYGHLDKPYVIALFGSSPFLDDGDFESVLYGEVECRYFENGPKNQEVRHVRAKNGLWRPSDSRGRKVSAVLVGTGILPWSPARELPRLWHNPWPLQRLGVPDLPFPITTANDRGEISHFSSNYSAEAILGLPAGWPEGEESFGDDV